MLKIALISIILLNSCVKTATKNTLGFSSGSTEKGGADTSVVAPPPPPPLPPNTPTVTVGDGHSGLTIDGKTTKYAAGTIIIVKAGTYPNGIAIQNLSDVSVQGTGVILDGLNQSKDGYYNILSLSNLTNVVVSGFTTKNCGYRMLNLNTRMVDLTLDHLTFINCAQGFAFNGPTLNWDGTDNTVNMLNVSITNCVFNICGNSSLGSNLNNGKITNLVKNLVISGNTYSGGDPGNLFQELAVDGFQIFNNVIDNINANNTNDNRLFMMTGNGDAYNNKFTNYEGHAIGINPVTFGTTPKICHISNNSCIGSFRYGAFEMQEFAYTSIPGVTTYANLVVDGNTVGNMNTSLWTGYPATFIDNYQFGLIGASTALTNNIGYNWFPTPAKDVFWNLAKPSVVSGNTYTTIAPK